MDNHITEAPFKGSPLPSDNRCPQPDPEGFGRLHQAPVQGPQGFQSVHGVETPLHSGGGGVALPSLRTCQKYKGIKWTQSAQKVHDKTPELRYAIQQKKYVLFCNM